MPKRDARSREEFASLQDPQRARRGGPFVCTACTQLLLAASIVSTLGIAIATLMRVDDIKSVERALRASAEAAEAAAGQSMHSMYATLVSVGGELETGAAHLLAPTREAHGATPTESAPRSAVYQVFCVLQPLVCAANVLLLMSIGVAGLRGREPTPRAAGSKKKGGNHECAAVFACLLDVEPEGVVLESVRKALDVSQLARVVVSYNTRAAESKRSSAALAALRKLDPEANRLCIVHDPASTSKAANLNAALKLLAAHDLALVLDADHHVDDAFVARMVAAMQKQPDRTACVQGAVLVRGDSAWETCLCVLAWYFFSLIMPTFELVSGTCMFVGGGAVWRTSVLQKLDGFNARFIAEDDDLSMRAIRAGYNIKSCPRAELTELAPASVAAFFQQRLRWTFGFEQSTNAHLLSLAHERPRALLARLYAWYSYLLVFAGVGVSVLAALSIDNGDLSAEELVGRSVVADAILLPPALLVCAAVAAALSRNGNKRFWQTWLCFPVTFLYGFAQALLFLYARARLLSTVCIKFKWRVTRRKLPKTDAAGGAASA